MVSQLLISDTVCKSKVDKGSHTRHYIIKWSKSKPQTPPGGDNLAILILYRMQSKTRLLELVKYLPWQNELNKGLRAIKQSLSIYAMKGR